MPDSAIPAVAPHYETHTRWGVEIGRLQLAVTRTRGVRGIEGGGVAAARRPAWPLAIGAFASVSALGLAVMGATAATRPAELGRYMLSVAVPAPAAPRGIRHARHRPTGRSAAASLAADDALAAGDAPYLAQALRSGGFQEWQDGVGQQRFLTAGPARAAADGRMCRDLALLVRLADGGSRVHTMHRCTTGPVSDEGGAVQGGDQLGAGAESEADAAATRE